MSLDALYFLIISAGGVYGASALSKKYEELLPVSILSIILVSYVFGLIGQMRLGAYVVFALAAALYLGSIVLNIKNKSWRNTFRLLATPGFVVTVVLYAILIVSNRNKLAYSWDEFSHWADVVKMMATQNQFASNPISGSVFKSYVPAMPLFQYNFQVLSQILGRGFEFSEWRLYFSYQIASYSLLIYFFKDLDWKKLQLAIVSSVVLFLLPSAFYSFYDVVYVDVFLGILAGFTFAQAVLFDPKRKLAVVVLLMSLSTLVLTKDIGFYVAVFICVFISVSFYARKPFNLNRLRSITALIASVALPKITWELHLSANSIGKSFGKPIDIAQFFRSVTSGDSSDYRWVTFQNYWKTMSETNVIIGDTSLQVSHLLLIILLLTGIFIVLSYLARHRGFGMRFLLINMLSISLFAMYYILIICSAYMFKFTEYEAVRLASFSRYMNFLCCMLLVLFAALLLQVIISSNQHTWKYSAIIVLALILPTGSAQNFLSGAYVRESIAARAPYSDAANEVQAIVGNESKRIYIISQGDTGFDYYVLKYSLRPHSVNDEMTWSIGRPFFDGDVWTQQIEPDAWMNSVFSSFDYVYIYKLNDYFVQTYMGYFSDSLIAANTLYKVDKSTRSLKLVGYRLETVIYSENEYNTQNEFLKTVDLAKVFDENPNARYQISFSIRTEKPGKIYVYSQNGSGSRYEFSSYIDTTETFSRHSITVIPNLVQPELMESYLAFYGEYGSGIIPSVREIEVQRIIKEQ